MKSSSREDWVNLKGYVRGECFFCHKEGKSLLLMNAPGIRYQKIHPGCYGRWEQTKGRAGQARIRPAQGGLINPS